MTKPEFALLMLQYAAMRGQSITLDTDQAEAVCQYVHALERAKRPIRMKPLRDADLSDDSVCNSRKRSLRSPPVTPSRQHRQINS
jgi:hypothetical protein